MGRKILAVIVAMIAAFAVILIVEMLNTAAFPPPSQEIMNDPDKLREFIANLPQAAFVVVLIGYIIAAFVGGFVATKIGRQVSRGIALPLIVGILLTIGGILNFFVLIPGQPIWFVAASLICFIPLALLGHRFAR